jgi:hypothetical protein
MSPQDDLAHFQRHRVHLVVHYEATDAEKDIGCLTHQTRPTGRSWEVLLQGLEAKFC